MDTTKQREKQVHQEQIDSRRQKLQDELLDRGQTEVALFDDLGVVIHKAHQHAGCGHVDERKDKIMEKGR